MKWRWHFLKAAMHILGHEILCINVGAKKTSYVQEYFSNFQGFERNSISTIHIFEDINSTLKNKSEPCHLRFYKVCKHIWIGISRIWRISTDIIPLSYCFWWAYFYWIPKKMSRTSVGLGDSTIFISWIHNMWFLIFCTHRTGSTLSQQNILLTSSYYRFWNRENDRWKSSVGLGVETP